MTAEDDNLNKLRKAADDLEKTTDDLHKAVDKLIRKKPKKST